MISKNDRIYLNNAIDYYALSLFWSEEEMDNLMRLFTKLDVYENTNEFTQEDQDILFSALDHYTHTLKWDEDTFNDLLTLMSVFMKEEL